MDIFETINTLETEMGIKTEVMDVNFIDTYAVGAVLGVDKKPYGTIVVMNDEKGSMQSCAYVGKYPGQTDVELPDIGNREQIILSLDTKVVPDSDISPRLVRTDYNTVPFLGIEYEGWDEKEGNQFNTRAVELAQDLLRK